MSLSGSGAWAKFTERKVSKYSSCPGHMFDESLAEIRKNTLLCDGSAKAVIPALMRRVMARLAQYHAVIHGVHAAEFNMLNVVSLSALRKTVSCAACLPQPCDTLPTTGTSIILGRPPFAVSKPKIHWASALSSPI